MFQPDIVFADPRLMGGAELLYTHWACAVREKGGEEVFFVFNEGYILNDDGKTIERIK